MNSSAGGSSYFSRVNLTEECKSQLSRNLHSSGRKARGGRWPRPTGATCWPRWETGCHKDKSDKNEQGSLLKPGWIKFNLWAVILQYFHQGIGNLLYLLKVKALLLMLISSAVQKQVRGHRDMFVMIIEAILNNLGRQGGGEPNAYSLQTICSPWRSMTNLDKALSDCDFFPSIHAKTINTLTDFKGGSVGVLCLYH